MRTTFLSRQNRIAPLTSGALVLWPITILSIVHQVRTTLEPGSASDFIPVWNAARDLIAGGQPYHQPGFVYPPSATLLFAPLGLLTFDRAHLIFHAVNAVGILFATFLAFRTFKVDLSSIAAPALTFAVFLSAPVRLTLYTENVNGIILAAAMAAFICAVARRWTAAGLAFGVTLAIKPVLMPLLMLFVFVRQWRAVASAVAVPVFLSAIALPFFGGASSFVTDVIPFLLKGNYAENYIINTSLRGAAEILGLPSWLASVARANCDPGACRISASLRYRAAEVRSPCANAISPAWRNSFASLIPTASAVSTCLRAS